MGVGNDGCRLGRILDGSERTRTRLKPLAVGSNMMRSPGAGRAENNTKTRRREGDQEQGVMGALRCDVGLRLEPVRTGSG